MKGHLYRVTVEKLEDNKGHPADADSIVFQVRNHDDLATVLEKIQSRSLFDKDESIAFAVGLKLFSEVMLNHRDMVLFSELAPHFKDFMTKLKSNVK